MAIGSILVSRPVSGRHVESITDASREAQGNNVSLRSPLPIGALRGGPRRCDRPFLFNGSLGPGPSRHSTMQPARFWRLAWPPIYNGSGPPFRWHTNQRHCDSVGLSSRSLYSSSWLV